MILEIPDSAIDQFPKMDWRSIGKLDWTVDDWTDWYHCIAFALWKIDRRHSKLPPVIDYQI
jgi:hypothetical protein